MVWKRSSGGELFSGCFDGSHSEAVLVLDAVVDR